MGHRDVRAEEGTTHVLEIIENVLQSVEAWAVGLAASPWVFVVLVLFVVVDAFFPPVPSETLVIAVAAYAVSTGGPPLWAIVAAVLYTTGKKELARTTGLPRTTDTVGRIPSALKPHQENS